MKFPLLFIFTFCFGLMSAQKSQQFIFKFNVKKWNKEFVKQQKIDAKETSSINLFDVSGKGISFEIIEKNISEVPVSNLKVFKGKSADGRKIISLTILPKSMSGSYLENGVQYFIEPVKGSCNSYQVYTNPKIDRKVEVGQINDEVK